MHHMRTEYILALRFFSGFRDLERGLWRPYGPPTISKLIEYLEKNRTKSIAVLLCKDRSFFKEHLRPQYLELEEFKYVRFIALPFVSLTRWYKFDLLISDVFALLFFINLVAKEKPRVLYCVRASQHIGAFFTLFKRPKVVLRIMGETGMYDFYKKVRNRILHPVTIFSLKAKFSCIIATIDGSPVRKLINECASSKVRKIFLFNGVDKEPYDTSSSKVDPRGVKILFIARLTEWKGIEEFIDVLHRVSLRKDNFNAAVIGYGPKEDIVKDKIIKYGLQDRVIVKGELQHTQVLGYYSSNDIFVSIGKLGNLGNTTLEALQAGMCIVMPGKSESGIDQDTERIIPADCAVRFSR